jgi:N-acetyl-gamma-glutamyl-phosphate/LysW-gamma-L-alpha-aminoadipyl-6-phosphate reductase
MARRFKAAIIGGSGYGAGEMLRRLLIHPEVEVARVASIDHVGKPVWHAHPHLTGLTDLVFEDLAPKDAARGCDVALLALPHKVTAAKVPELIELGVKIVDMSGDFRLTDAGSVPEVLRQRAPAPRAARHVRLRPARAQPRRDQGVVADRLAGLLRDDDRAGAVAAGQGRAPGRRDRPRRRHHRLVGLGRGAAGGHAPPGARGQPQDLQAAGAPAHAGDPAGAGGGRRRGPRAAVHAGVGAAVARHLRHRVPRAAGRRGRRQAAGGAVRRRPTAGEPFVRRPTTRLPEVAAVSGSNYAEVGFTVGEPAHGRRTVVCFAAVDNLIKGGAGQAIQNMNLVLGLDEKLSLQDPGGWP